MAVLQKIRKRSGLLLGVIGFALLAFIIQDLIQNGI
jgi:peptidyl-prolyl cis-trans isomerase D